SAWASACTTSISLHDALASSSYRWDVTACSGVNGTGTCVTGSNATFSTQAPVNPVAPTPVSPSGGQVITTLTPSLVWSGGSNFKTLQVHLCTSPTDCPPNCVF